MSAAQWRVSACGGGPTCETASEFVAAVSGQDATIGGSVEFALEGDAMDMQFITSVAVITPEPAVSRRLYVDALGLPLTAEADGYLHSEDIDGCKSFGVWPLTQAAQACFGTPDWPVERPVPQASVEFGRGRRHRPGRSGRVEGEGLHAAARRTYRAVGTNRRSTAVHRGRDHRHLLRAHDAFVKSRNGIPSGREGFLYAAAGWSAASLSYWMGDFNAAELCRRRLL